MQSPNIKMAEILENYKLLVTFINGETKVFDMKEYLKYPVFRPLNDDIEFKKFSIVDGTIEWECGAELSSDTFYLNSVTRAKDEIKEM
jgi:hypothetical protein